MLEPDSHWSSECSVASFNGFQEPNTWAMKLSLTAMKRAANLARDNTAGLRDDELGYVESLNLMTDSQRAKVRQEFRYAKAEFAS